MTKISRATKISYAFIALVLLLAGWLHLTTPLLVVMFSVFVLSKLDFARSRWVAIILFLVIVAGVGFGAFHFIKEAREALPKIAEESVPKLITWAEANRIQVPFTDYKSLKATALEAIREQTHYIRNLANFAKGATTQLVLVIIGMVVAVSLYVNSQLDLDRGAHRLRNNLYSLSCDEISIRFWTFYQSFATVMGAQIIISLINTLLTAIFLVAVRIPYAPVVIGLTFLCGLLPVIGNLISNTIITCVAFTVSPQMAVAALVFLVVIHKLEYLLNSKIIGDRIRNPVWLTLLGLIIGERLLGIAGMILAPVVLHYLKTEASRIELVEPPDHTTTEEPEKLFSERA